jgi:hypothetical protein
LIQAHDAPAAEAHIGIKLVQHFVSHELPCFDADVAVGREKRRLAKARRLCF